MAVVEVLRRIMKPMSLLTILLPVLLLVPSTDAKEPRESSADPRMAYQSLRQDPRFQEPLRFDALDYPRLHTALFYATNAVRVQHGLAPLAYHPRLEQAAWHYAKRMVERDFMAHVDPYAAALRTPEQRLRAAGVVNAMPAENLATYFGIQYREGKRVYRLAGGKGQFSRMPNGPPIPPHTYRSFAEAAVDSWMSSPGHRANILAETALELGCGAAFFWSANDFPKFKLVQLYQLYELAKP
jgi:uncharacterized protein YkwD